MSGLAEPSLSGQERIEGRVAAGVCERLDRALRPATWSHRLRCALKRSLDVVVSATLIAVLAIPLILIAILVKLDSPGPVFYRVSRVGYRGRPLLMLKFRKMHEDAGGIPLTAHHDTRLTRVGAGLVQLRLDELPQLWDVLRGRMSIIGPRPEDPVFVSLHADAYDRILTVRPGITGLSQLAFVEERRILDQDDLVGDYVERILPQKIWLDRLYTDSHRSRMDLAILGWTLAAIVLRKQVAVHRSSGALNLRRRPSQAASGSPPVQPGELLVDATAPTFGQASSASSTSGPGYTDLFGSMRS